MIPSTVISNNHQPIFNSTISSCSKSSQFRRCKSRQRFKAVKLNGRVSGMCRCWIDEMILLNIQASNCTHCREIHGLAMVDIKPIDILSAQRLNRQFMVKCLKSVLLTLSIAQRSDQWRCLPPPVECVLHDFLLQFSGKQGEFEASLAIIKNRC
jgi:hypothetical protein